MKNGFLFILLAVPWGAAQSSPDAPASESKILALENAWGQAEKLRDRTALDSLLDNSLVYIRYDGAEQGRVSGQLERSQLARGAGGQ
jgi:hypothetical protein